MFNTHLWRGGGPAHPLGAPERKGDHRNVRRTGEFDLLVVVSPAEPEEHGATSSGTGTAASGLTPPSQVPPNGGYSFGTSSITLASDPEQSPAKRCFLWRSWPRVSGSGPLSSDVLGRVAPVETVSSRRTLRARRTCHVFSGPTRHHLAGAAPRRSWTPGCRRSTPAAPRR